MDTEPTSWQELLDAPEIPKNFEGRIVIKKAYSNKKDDPNMPQLSFIPLLLKIKLDEEEYKWYISNASASCLQSAGYRQTALMPIDTKRCKNHFCYFYNYDVTKRYGECFFEKKGKINFHPRVLFHMILMFFSEDKNWEPFHNDLMHNHSYNTELLKPSYFSLKDITEKMFGCEEIEMNDEGYTKGEIAFLRALFALCIAYRSIFQQQTDYNNFVRNQLVKFNNITNYGISFESFICKADFKQFKMLSGYRLPILRNIIYGYFFALNNLEGDYVRNAIKEFQTVSFFNIIYRFLTMEDKREVHFNQIILKDVDLYVQKIKELSPFLGERLPYAELLYYQAMPFNWKNLAGVALFYAVKTYPDCTPSNNEQFLKKLNMTFPDIEENFEKVSNEQPVEIYKLFGNMEDVHENMKNIPWNENHLDTQYAYFLCKQFIDDFYY